MLNQNIESFNPNMEKYQFLVVLVSPIDTACKQDDAS